MEIKLIPIRKKIYSSLCRILPADFDDCVIDGAADAAVDQIRMETRAQKRRDKKNAKKSRSAINQSDERTRQ